MGFELAPLGRKVPQDSILQLQRSAAHAEMLNVIAFVQYRQEYWTSELYKLLEWYEHLECAWIYDLDNTVRTDLGDKEQVW